MRLLTDLRDLLFSHPPVITFFLGASIAATICVVYSIGRDEAVVAQYEADLAIERAARRQVEGENRQLADVANQRGVELDRMRRAWMWRRECWWFDFADMPTGDSIPPQNVPVSHKRD